MKTELIPQYERVKSFYHKAIVENDEEIIQLYSYSTLVCKIDTFLKRAYVYGTHSPTTLRHIKEFLKQNGFKAESKAQIEADYTPTTEQREVLREYC